MRRPFGVTFGSIFHAAAPKRRLGGSRNARVNEQVRGRGKPGGHQLIDLRPALVSSKSSTISALAASSFRSRVAVARLIGSPQAAGPRTGGHHR